MSSAIELYTKDTRIWIPDVDRVWKGAVLIENYKQNEKKIRVETDDGNTVDYDLEVPVSSSTPHLKQICLPPLRNPEILIGQNDLTSLSYLNEPEVLYNLEVRFINNNQIYTYCGIVLVAINPYEQLPIYGNEIIQAYNGCDVQHMDPHIFAVSEEAFQKMRQFGQNQSIIVSGESGAGKTVSAKYAMRYFANVGGSSEETQIEKKVLASNPIMEAFGNAKTTRNDNSSRFGKFIQIDFSRHHHIIGASMKTYLLEKSRVVFQAKNERNYHIFYQLCSQRTNKKYSHLKLGKPEDFIYTNQGDASTIDNIDDSSVFKETLDAFNLLGIKPTEQDLIFNIISSIMHLGNVKLVESNSEQTSCVVKKNDEALATMCKLLSINEEQMKQWLCNKRIKTASEIVNVQLTLSQAYFARDALAKHMYSQLFNWIVNQINKCLKSNSKANSFIGVLDIYGFETFVINSFEQFCINYANEKLQQQFCQHVFKLEQEEYMREQIKWSFIEFYDNQPCIDLIEGKLGILDLLDEECKMPKGSDVTWCNKLYDKHLKTSNHFSKPRMSQKSFIIHHFAEHVEYQVDGFLEKNRDTVLEDQLKVIKNSESDFIAELFLEDGDEEKPKGYEVRKNTLPAPSKMQINRKKTVGSQFRESLQSLMTALNSTIPHYVRCIKPNDLKAPFQFEAKRAVEQLRACGVLETVRISAAGYPSRWTYMEFFQRYRMLAHSKLINRKQIRETCERILISLIKDQTKYQFGKTKIFFQAGQVAYLEKLRSEKLKLSGITIQKHIRGWLARSKYLKIKKSILLMQKFSKGVLARRLLKYKRDTRAAITIQSHWRSYKCRINYRKTIQKLIKIQAYCRGFIARKNRDMIANNLKAIKIQSCVRGWLQRIRYRKILRGIVLVQSHYRRRKARKLFKLMKIELKSVEHQRQLNKGLENKIISLQQNIEKINKEREQLNNKVSELEPLKQQLISLKTSASTNKENQVKLNDLNEQLNELRGELSNVKKEKELIIKERDEVKLNLNKSNKNSNDEITSLRMKLEEANLKLQVSQLKIDELNCQLAELQSERANHQKLIKEHSKLESRFEKARSELLKYRNLQPTSTETTSVLETLLEDLDLDNYNNKESSSFVESTNENKKSSVKDDSISTITAVSKSPQQHAIENEDHDYDIITSQELELENHRLRDDLNRLRKLYDDNENEGAITNEIKSQFLALGEELQRRRDECIHLKTILLNKNRASQNHSNLENVDDSIEGLVTEGNEFEMAYSSQKILNRMLENQLQESQKNFEITKNKLLRDNQQLKEENERQHEILMKNLPPETLAEVTYKYEIGKLSDENLALRERCEELCEEAKKYKKVLKVYIRKSKQAGNQSSNFNSSFYESAERTALSSMSTATLTHSNFENNSVATTAFTGATSVANTNTSSSLFVPQIKFKNGECMGVLEWKLEDQEKIISRLIYDLKPRLAVTFLPGTPSYILFMCIRYADILNDDERVRSLLDTTVTAIKKLIKKRQEDLEYVILWLANLCRLLHNLKQYSGESAFQTHNTPKQNDHCLKNFDLTEYRGILSDIAIWLFQGIIKDFEKKLLPLIVPAMLDHVSLPGMEDAKPNGLRGSSNEETKKEKITIDVLIKKLTEFLKILNSHGVDPEIVNQIFKQLFFYIGSNTFNNLILRKEMCHWSKGIEIRFNVSHLEQWIRDSKLQDSGALPTLEPIIQASQLLQARKTENDIKSICDMCSVLTIAQIQRILMLYTPIDEYEEKLSRSFIDKVVKELREIRQFEMESTQTTVVVDTQLTFPICIPFNPSNIGLETIEIPEQLNLSGILKKL